MKSTYFPHDYHARYDLKLMRLTAKGWDLLGLYWCVIEMLHEEGGYLKYDPKGIAEALRTQCDRITILLEEPELFIVEGDRFTAHRVLENLNKLHKESETGRISAYKRWHPDKKPLATQCPPNAIREDKIREDKKDKDIPPAPQVAQEFFNYYLLKTKRGFKLTRDNLEMIKKRLAEGYTLEQLKTAVDNFVADPWEGRVNHMELIYCIGKQRGKPDALERWINIPKVDPWDKYQKKEK